MNTDHKVDRSTWGPGPWDNEPDRLEFEFFGLSCLMVRNDLGNWCGYAAVPVDHPLYGHPYDDEAVDVNVHGGLTYADNCQGRICHIPKPGESDDVWWFGFDCAHLGDVTPGLRNLGGTYKDVAFVREQVLQLAEQLSQVEK